MRHVLVVADETLVGTHVTRRLHELHVVEPIDVVVVVPVAGSNFDESLAKANHNLEQALEAVTKLGIDVRGHVGSADPMAAIHYALDKNPGINLILLSTLPAGRSKWIAMDLPHRVKRRFDVAVEHLEGSPADQAASATLADDLPIKVMIVEDDPDDLELAKLALEGLDDRIQVLATGTGDAALHFIREGSRVDLILLDLKMPTMGGFEMLEEMESNLGIDTLNELNVAVLSSSSAQSDRDRAHALGVCAYLVKQPDFDEFQSALGSLIREVTAR